MSMLGIGKGLFRIVEGVIEADADKIVRGVGGTATSAVGVIVTNFIHENVGEGISQAGEAITSDEYLM